MWQGIIDVVQEWNGHAIPIDVNVAAMRDPSAHPAPPTESLPARDAR
jgi:hypothetical protein